MAAEWRIEDHERAMARKVCSRTYETLDDYSEHVRETWGEDDTAVQVALEELRERLKRVLPFDPEVKE